MRKILFTCIAILLAQIAFTQITYTFTGNGNWSDSANWLNKVVPPEVLPKGSEIIIDPAGTGACILDKSQIIAKGATFTVNLGKKFTVPLEFALADSSHSYLTDSTEYFLGAIPATDEELQQIPDVEASDTLNFSQKEPGLFSLKPSWIINVPEPELQFHNCCVAWAVGWGVLGYMNYISEKNESYDGEDKKFSADFIFNQLNGGANEGLTFPAVLEFVKTKGDCKYVDMPENPSFTVQPSVNAKINAMNYKILNYKHFATLNIDTLKLFLSKNRPLPFIAKIDEGFTGRSPMSYINKGSRQVYVNKSGKDTGIHTGNHAMVLCGYNDSIRAFKVLNSWGKTWGPNGGFVWIDYVMFSQMVVRSPSGIPEIYLVDPQKPNVTVVTVPVTSITATSASSGGIVTNQGSSIILETGICYSNKKNPTTASTLVTNISITGGTSVGNFTSSLTNLLPESEYYIRAFARTDNGVAYGDELKFTATDSQDGTFTDPRDGQLYPYKKIGTQVWMTKNLNYAVDTSQCYDNNTANCDIYGRLYSWYDAMMAAPPGWHLPSDSEWTTLTDYLGGEAVAGDKMKTTGTIEDGTGLWTRPNEADNSSGFAGLPGGTRDNNSVTFSFIGDNGYWWSSTTWDGSTNYAWYRFLIYYQSDIYNNTFHKRNEFSVRCIRD